MLSLLAVAASLAAGVVSTPAPSAPPVRTAWDLDFISKNASLPKVV
jgi:hypothetical protein